MMDANALRQLVAELDTGGQVPPTAPPAAGEAFGAVVAGSIMAHDEGGAEQRQRDALQCLLLAQLVADRQHDRHKEPASWYRVYGRTLGLVGWGVEANSMLLRYRPPRTSFTIRTAVTDMLSRSLIEDEVALVTAALTALKQEDQDSPASVVFEGRSHSGGLGNFQVGVIIEDGESVSLRIGQFRFTTTQVTELLTQEFDSTADFFGGFLALKLNNAVYEPVRNQIAKKLGSKVEELVHVFPIVRPLTLTENEKTLTV